MSQPGTLESPETVTETVTPRIADDTRIIGNPYPDDPKVARVCEFAEGGLYDLPEVVDASLDPLALELGLDRVPVRAWQPGDLARLDTPSGRYLVEVVRIEDDHVWPAGVASVRVLDVYDAHAVSGLHRGAEGMWPVNSLQLASVT